MKKGPGPLKRNPSKEKICHEELPALDIARGVERIYVPGEKEFLEEEKRRKEGIPVPEAQIGEFKKMAQDLGLETPF